MVFNHLPADMAKEIILLIELTTHSAVELATSRASFIIPAVASLWIFRRGNNMDFGYSSMTCIPWVSWCTLGSVGCLSPQVQTKLSDVYRLEWSCILWSRLEGMTWLESWIVVWRFVVMLVGKLVEKCLACSSIDRPTMKEVVIDFICMSRDFGSGGTCLSFSLQGASMFLGSETI
ncbi:protein kinase family protein [Striga asiatica]|uniref:Protein kinase family protein n=1 Tax=Striga asiatica TaxID=4170 RepID=A0A5A7QR94_STRAF|nr:protein kinase family protein [Striga asiatica]GER50712.1 protein kinase family protein [Striga asiatica]